MFKVLGIILLKTHPAHVLAIGEPLRGIILQKYLIFEIFQPGGHGYSNIVLSLVSYNYLTQNVPFLEAKR